jgi:hypothetical protein
VLTTTHYALTASQVGTWKEENQETQQQYSHKRRSGPFATNTTTSLTEYEQQQIALPTTATGGTRKSWVGAGWLLHSEETARGDEWSSLRLFITSQTCNGNRELLLDHFHPLNRHQHFDQDIAAFFY